MGASRALTPWLRAATFETLIGLLAVSGLRRGEALGLDRRDVDLQHGALHVRAAKQNKRREVPLHDSTTRALDDYSRLRDRHLPEPTTSAFSYPPTACGSREARSTVRSRSSSARSGWKEPARCTTTRT